MSAALAVALIVSTGVVVLAVAVILHRIGSRDAERRAAMSDEERDEQTDRNAW